MDGHENELVLSWGSKRDHEMMISFLPIIIARRFEKLIFRIKKAEVYMAGYAWPSVKIKFMKLYIYFLNDLDVKSTYDRYYSNTVYNNILETKLNILYKESYKKVTILF